MESGIPGQRELNSWAQRETNASPFAFEPDG